jgi:tol-pal system protein YbgF
MKRLVAYLIVVISLGLTFSVSADDYPFDTSVDKQYDYTTQFLKDGDYDGAEKAFKKFLEINPKHNLSGNAQYWLAETFRVRQLYTDAALNYLIGYQKYPKSTKAPINLLKLGVSLVQIDEKEQGCKMIVGMVLQYPYASSSVKEKAKYEAQKFKCDKQNKDYLAEIPKLLKEYDLEAKAEPSQTQKMVKKKVRQISLREVQNLYNQIVGCWSVPLGLPYNADLKVKIKLKLRDDGTIIKTEIVDHARMNMPGQAYYKVLVESVLRAVKNCQPLDLPRDSYESWKDMVLNFDAEKMIGGDYSGDLQIAEKERKGEINKIIDLIEGFCAKKSNIGKYIFVTPITKDTNCKYHYVNKEEDINLFDAVLKERSTKSLRINQSFQIRTNAGEYSTKLTNKILLKGSKKLIAKTETTVKPKKKVKIVKKEPEQEEFKPKKTNQDNEAPVIEIAEAITVNDSSYEFKGKVTDKAKTIYVEIDGRPVEVKKGQFVVKGYTPIDKQISITAIDQWGNKSKPKLVNIVLDQKDTIVADMFEALDPSKIRSKSNKNRVALIIGIEKYNQTPDATFANLDAQYFYEYARKGFGISKSNIKLLVDEDANLVSSLGTLSKWLPGKIKSGETELIIFFAGHGLASNDGKELYLLPQDSDPDLLTRTALSRTELFKEIIALNPKSVTMFLDTCYSGVSRDEKTLLASARPVRIVADEQDTPDNFTIFSASQLDQISSGFKEAKHGIFSYYLMKGLEGKADANKDKDITNGELLAYMDQNVAQKASELGRQQNPSLAGDPDKILMSYR